MVRFFAVRNKETLDLEKLNVPSAVKALSHSSQNTVMDPKGSAGTGHCHFQTALVQS